MVSVVQNLSVEVLDVNEAPTLLTLSGPQALPASVSGDYEVGTISVTDPDHGQTHTLLIKGPNSDLLMVSAVHCRQWEAEGETVGHLSSTLWGGGGVTVLTMRGFSPERLHCMKTLSWGCGSAG